jgi:hypothetical protein
LYYGCGDEAKDEKRVIGYGGVVAAPAFKNVAKQIISYLGIETKKEEICKVILKYKGDYDLK